MSRPSARRSSVKRSGARSHRPAKSADRGCRRRGPRPWSIAGCRTGHAPVPSGRRRPARRCRGRPARWSLKLTPRTRPPASAPRPRGPARRARGVSPFSDRRWRSSRPTMLATNGHDRSHPWPAADPAAILEHGHRSASERSPPAGEDVDNRRAPLAHPAHPFEQEFGIAPGDDRGRLVEDQEPGVADQRLGDLEHLLVGDRRCLTRARGSSERQAQPERPAPAGAWRGGRSAQAGRVAPRRTSRSPRRSSRETVRLPDRSHERRRARRLRARPRPALAREGDRADIRLVGAGDDLDQGRLARAVLPTNACTSPAATSKSTASSDRTPGNRWRCRSVGARRPLSTA